ncbi:30S ribosomal protein S4 [Candidatus Shapirobacteria bacterium CG03_land_8_20_14_0_80_40_19]|uniref:Small ribosomal subunit protein uS4 n=4 Tax=Candidatus Shapironibacteriota TaxID=1752721 RepID=A0A2M7BE23_9BACT|nr:MAG: 30S ribosomal protein S4 [Candidatus Shapirobacteria bacterium CG11_big_fil_rev_8_21_14_0_20_40_12]PIV01339.1 MAG: 30S ribosomal protein S4 [Candidatus Shapirobacteria bacterium CG03_land_8_20_14_0_80_40_19]PJC29215.1 MAG: 30S ribosomal protein S4 [Candidatus Shapirobacteria bacterium CG_4_9_14_0_2_um_filter_40_11]PJC76674.1 MAG: 30S ribosomal protein S4 [Candidatus Shapirobacteria bacterium CG_4_8_14_3_um_filter_39_11]
MTAIRERKCRLCRQSGKKLFLKGERCLSKCPIDRRGAVPPGQHGNKRKRKPSEYGIHLSETMKVKRIFGINERQLRNCFRQARKVREATGESLLQILESRLDNLVYRLGFASSRRLARQLVDHGHVLVDGKKVNIPSFLVKENQLVSLGGKALNLTEVKKKLEEKDYKLPVWLERKVSVGKLSRLPKKEEMETEIDEQLLVEYYSRK